MKVRGFVTSLPQLFRVGPDDIACAPAAAAIATTAASASFMWLLLGIRDCHDNQTPSRIPLRSRPLLPLSADGHQVSYNLYMGLNARGQFGKCVFGGSF